MWEGAMRDIIRTIAAAAVALGLAAAPAAADQLADIKERGTLVVGVKNDYKPWGFLDPSGAIVGMEIDLARDVAERLGTEIELVPVKTLVGGK